MPLVESATRAHATPDRAARRAAGDARPAPGQAVLILDAQTNQALACVRSLGRAGCTVLVASQRRAPLASWSRYCSGAFRLAGQSLGALAAAREWAVRHGVRCVLPLTERSCLLCDADRAAWEASGIIVGCGPGDMMLQAFDKARTLRL